MAEEMKWHPAANIFPMMEEKELTELSEDIKANGQQEPCLICDGMVIDGRNRWMACLISDIKAKTKVVSPEDPVGFVLSLNLHRRHLTPSQRSMCAARARELFDKQAKERMSEGGGDKKSGVANFPPPIANQQKARDAAGKAFSVSGRSVDHATRVIEKGIPELAKAVDEGRMAVSTAAIIASEPEEVQKAEVENPKRNRQYGTGVGASLVKKKPEKKPRHEGEHDVTETFALTKADVAITQLKGIPNKNKFRDAALLKVLQWVNSQLKEKKNG